MRFVPGPSVTSLMRVPIAALGGGPAVRMTRRRPMPAARRGAGRGSPGAGPWHARPERGIRGMRGWSSFNRWTLSSRDALRQKGGPRSSPRCGPASVNGYTVIARPKSRLSARGDASLPRMLLTGVRTVRSLLTRRSAIAWVESPAAMTQHLPFPGCQACSAGRSCSACRYRNGQGGQTSRRNAIQVDLALVLPGQFTGFGHGLVSLMIGPTCLRIPPGARP